MTKTRRVACLYRVSTLGQLDKLDMPMQRQSCQAFIDQKPGWVLVEEYEEKGVSGYRKPLSKRPVMQRLLGDASQGCFDVLLVFMFDRLGRQEKEMPFLAARLWGLGVALYSVCEGPLRLEDAGDRLMNYIRFWHAGGESANNSQRVSEAHRQLVAAGKYRGGSPPYGYQLVESREVNRRGRAVHLLTPLPEEEAVVTRIFYMAAHQQAGGYKIAKTLNAQGIPTQKGNNWRPAAIYRLLQNPLYKGVYGGHFYPHLALVHADVWEKANTRRPQPKAKAEAALLNPLLHCRACGARMAKKGRANSYYCTGKTRLSPCTGPYSIPAGATDAAVVQAVSHILPLFGLSAQKPLKKRLRQKATAIHKAYGKTQQQHTHCVQAISGFLAEGEPTKAYALAETLEAIEKQAETLNTQRQILLPFL